MVGMSNGTIFKRPGDLALHMVVDQDDTHYVVQRQSWGLASVYRYRLRKT